LFFLSIGLAMKGSLFLMQVVEEYEEALNERSQFPLRSTA
jgi:hypothetical protein